MTSFKPFGTLCLNQTVIEKLCGLYKANQECDLLWSVNDTERPLDFKKDLV